MDIANDITKINLHLAAIGREDLFLPEAASTGEIQYAERVIEAVEGKQLMDEIRQSVSQDTPRRSEIIHEKFRRAAFLKKVPKFLTALVEKAKELQGEAASAAGAADAALSKAVDRHERYEQKLAELEEARRIFKRAADTHAAVSAEFAKADAEEAVYLRWIRAVDLGGSPTLHALAVSIDGGRGLFTVILKEWPRIEKVLKNRMNALEEDIRRIQSESLN